MRKMVAALAFVFALVLGAFADGSNVVDVVGDNMSNGINVFTPIVLGLLSLGIVIGLVKWFARKK